MSYYPAPNCHIRNGIKIELDLSNYLTKKELHHATSFHASNLRSKNFLFFES